MKRFLIVFMACLMPVMLMGADWSNNAKSLAALKVLAMRGEDCSKYLGWFVYADGGISEYDRPGVTDMIFGSGNHAGYWTSTQQGSNAFYLNRSLGGTALSTYNYLKVRAVFAF